MNGHETMTYHGNGVLKKTRKRKIPPMDFSDCIESTPEDTLKFILGLEIPDWKLIGSRIGNYEGTSVTHFFGTPRIRVEALIKV